MREISGIRTRNGWEVSQATRTSIKAIKNKIKAVSRKRADTGIIEKYPRRYAWTVDAPRCSRKKETELVAGGQRPESKKTPTHRPKAETREGMEERRGEREGESERGREREERKEEGKRRDMRRGKCNRKGDRLESQPQPREADAGYFKAIHRIYSQTVYQFNA